MSEAVGGIVELSHRTCRVCTNIMSELMRIVEAQVVAKNLHWNRCTLHPPIPLPSLFLLRVLLAGVGGGCLGFFLFVQPNCMAFRILVPQPGIIPRPQQ